LDTFFLRLKRRFKAFLLQSSVPYQFDRGLGKFKKKRSFGSKKFVSRKKRGYPTYFFKKLLRSRSGNFAHFNKGKGSSFNDFLTQNIFKKYVAFMSGRTRGLFEFFNTGSNFFFFYPKSNVFLNLKTLFSKSVVGFLRARNKRIQKFKGSSGVAKRFVAQRKNRVFVKLRRVKLNKIFPVSARFLFQVPSYMQAMSRVTFLKKSPYRKRKYTYMSFMNLKRTNVIGSSFVRFQTNLKSYVNRLHQFFGYDVFRVYKQKHIQDILKVLVRVRRRYISKSTRVFSKPKVVSFVKRGSHRSIDYRHSWGSRVKDRVGSPKTFSFKGSVKNQFNSTKAAPWGHTRRKLTFFSKIFFFRVMVVFSNFFNSIDLNSKGFVVMFRLIFVVFFKKFISVYYKKLRKIVGTRVTRRMGKRSFNFKRFFKRISRKLFLKYYFYFLNFFIKLFRLRKIYLHLRRFSKQKHKSRMQRKEYSKFSARFKSFVQRLVFFLSVTCLRIFMRKNIKKYVRYLYSQFTFRFARFLQFKLARLTNCKNLANLKVRFIPLSCYHGITPDVYLNFLRLKIRRRFSFKSLIRPFIKGLKFMRFLRGVYGLGNGRFTRRQRASTVKVSKGKIAFSSVSAYLVYSFLPVVTRFGTCGVHIFFNFKKSKVKFKYKVGSIFRLC
jgi:hypothetical protein